MSEEISTHGLSVKHIGILSFNINKANFGDNKDKIRFEVKHRIQFAVEKDVMNIGFLIQYFKPKSEEPFLQMEIETIFGINNLRDFVPPSTSVTTENMNIPENILIIIAETSYCHARALVSDYTKGTVAQGIYLPILNGRSFAKHIFGHKIK